MKTTRQKWIKKLDDLFSKYIRLIGECEVEGCKQKETLQCAHVISRKYEQTRWDPENAVCLCYRHHLHWAHKEPHEFVRWFDKKYGGDLYDKLKRRAQKIEKIDYELVYGRLKALYDATR